jgi:hypothetical protein
MTRRVKSIIITLVALVTLASTVIPAIIFLSGWIMIVAAVSSLIVTGVIAYELEGHIRIYKQLKLWR